MNNSDLPIFTSKESLTIHTFDFFNVYVLPSICLFGIFTSIICVMVTFKRDESNAKTFDYIFLNSAIDLVFLIIESFLFIIRCGSLCPYGFSYSSKFYEIYFYLYVGYILVTSQVLLNIYVAYDRYKMFTAKSTSLLRRQSIFVIYAVCVFISALANAIPYLISKQVLPLGVYKPFYINASSDGEILYMQTLRTELSTPGFKTFLTVVNVVKDPTLFCFLCLLNIFVCLRFRNHFKTRKLLFKRPNTISMSFFYFIYFKVSFKFVKKLLFFPN